MLRKDYEEIKHAYIKRPPDPMVKGKSFESLGVPRINVRKNRWMSNVLQLLEAL